MNQNPNNKAGCLFSISEELFPHLIFLFHQDEQDSFGFDDDAQE